MENKLDDIKNTYNVNKNEKKRENDDKINEEIKELEVASTINKKINLISPIVIPKREFRTR